MIVISLPKHSESRSISTIKIGVLTRLALLKALA